MGSLYHEKQVSLLCGVHALNTLLQGPYFTANDLRDIAAEFDQRERDLMKEAGVDSADFLRYMAEDSGNAAVDGNFSIQVLTKALDVWNVDCVPVTGTTHSEALVNTTNELAFLCNLDQHWFAVRKTRTASPTVHAEAAACGDGGWWNFNSMLPAPQPIGTTYLSAFLAQLREERYSIFAVRGNLPDEFGRFGEGGEHGRWVTVHEAAAANRESDRVKAAGRARNIASNMLAKLGAGGWGTIAVPASVAERAGASLGGTTSNADEDAELQAAIAASLGGGNMRAEGAGGGVPSGGVPSTDGGLDDADVARAIAASLEPNHHPSPHPPSDPDPTPVPTAAWAVPEEPGVNEGIALAFRVPGGGRLQRRFRTTDAVGALEAWLGREAGIDFAVHSLTVAFPRRRLTDRGSTLGECGVGDKTALSVESGR
ncbi:ataxin-3 [Micromonas commoda]|uniref:ubiquitinyl hydrolase 1 n=1 Tax=Micromonas commoda (strain RCC299 / NOUM17 / CCMP2709) TaxID=296587 RepID=C1EGU0_MICCC|nr:ataxin-3 [Micromonas commoda]ACO67184.1 ataxin-3 [Micromonas commoda]|eukprot:XP_002505926.1 ataxin-3 [Micromonas commoda]